MPALLEPHGIDRGDGKRPDGMTIFPFTRGQCLIWDATCVNTYANSRLASAAGKAGAAAGDAEAEKRRKYSDLCRRFRFEPVAFETSGACGPSTKRLLREIGTQVSAVTGEHRETEWLLQRCSIAIARGNAASILLARSSAGEATGRTPPVTPLPANAATRAPAEGSQAAGEVSSLEEKDAAHNTARETPHSTDAFSPSGCQNQRTARQQCIRVSSRVATRKTIQIWRVICLQTSLLGLQSMKR